MRPVQSSSPSMSFRNAKKQANRPKPLRTTKSFSRGEPAVPAALGDMSRPERASTFQNGAAAAGKTTTQASEPDTFESRISEEAQEHPRASVDLDDLPIELIGLTDSFIDHLSAKTWSTPPNVDNLSKLFQEFYATAAQHVQTHISALNTRQKRENSPVPSPPRASAASILRAKAASLGNREKPKPAASLPRRDSEQMLTAEEFAERKRARKLLEQKKGLYEEAVERRLCEGIYDKLYRHRSTQDEAQDDKLRSKTAALAVVRIGPADLGVDLGLGPVQTPEAIAERHEAVKNWLEGARNELVLMGESRYPLGKLNRLKAAHKSIIDTLAHFHPSSSADELMPMLIYTLITMPPDKLHVISDMNFVQRFRWQQKLHGEQHLKPGPSPTSIRAAVQLRNRRFSDLVNTPAQAIGAASDAVDQSIKTIGMSLSESYRFLLGKLRENPEGLPRSDGEVLVPKTLEEARKFIDTPSPNDDNDSVTSSTTPDEGERTRQVSNPLEDKIDASSKSIADGGDLATAFPDIAAALPPKEVPKINPPIKRFIEMQNPADLRIGEVLELLRDYRRLAGALKDLGAFKT
ncbi:hypothetical protein P8C59_000677 [Phyllachora maydis]|uniref:VPS9 domain-containing protein n=1 Tax=Phyllachora maydis TaxID=1825666 RepID=A0AAD9HWP5_9PEZI|nr:hypothetical protein P8C59_000677 [Phyllachora maydis]